MARSGNKDRGLFERPKGIWWIRYADADGIERREKVGPKSAAKTLYQARKVAIMKGEKLPELVKPKIYTFAQLADDGLAWSKLNKASWMDDENRLKPLKEAFGTRPADGIKAHDFERFLDAFQLERDITGATINRYRAVLQMIYREGKRRGSVRTNPARDISPRANSRNMIRFLSDDEERRLIAELRNPIHRTEVYFALLTGVRRGAQYGLKWSDIDLNERTAKVHEKNGHDRRVDLHPALIPMLRELPRDESGFVFRSGKVNRGYGMNFFIDALNRAGIRNFRWHDLRHTFASRMAMAGWDTRRVQEAMGHKTIAMTARYTHLRREDVREAVDSFAPVTLLTVETPIEGRVQ